MLNEIVDLQATKSMAVAKDAAAEKREGRSGRNFRSMVMEFSLLRFNKCIFHVPDTFGVLERSA